MPKVSGDVSRNDGTLHVQGSRYPKCHNLAVTEEGTAESWLDGIAP